jgi:hypothetical protein
MMPGASRHSALHLIGLLVITFVLLFIVVSLNVGCTPSSPTVEEEKKGPALTRAEVITAVTGVSAGSACANYNFISRNADGSIRYTTGKDGKTRILSNQGKPKKAFLGGIAMTYARAYCRQGDVYKTAGQSLGGASGDALTHYSSIAKREKVPYETVNDRAQATFSLMVGSAAHESSWNVCAGRDGAANNVGPETIEAAAFQTSWNSRYNSDGKTISPKRMALFRAMLADRGGCFTSEYGQTCRVHAVGSGDAREFQLLQRSCPGFATNYHALMVRERRTHYGPINQQYADLTKACFDMFGSIRAWIEANPAACAVI